jgi:hypothetical protein
MRPLHALLLAPLLTACTVDRAYQTSATPQRPTVSYDTHTTATGTVELEAGFAIDPNDRFGSPALLKYGVDERTELFLGFEPYVTVDRPGSDGHGFGDLMPGIRRRVMDQDGSTPAAAYLVAAKIPTADEDEGIGTGEVDLFAAGIVGWDDAAWSAYGMYQLGLLGEPTDGGTDLQHVLTAAGSRPIDNRLSAFGELAFLWTPEQDDEDLLGTLGIAYAYQPGMVFDLGLTLGLSQDAPDAVFQIGTTINFGPQAWRIRP